MDLLEGAEKKSGWEHPGEYSSLSQFASGLDRRDRALAFEIAGGVQRNRLYLDYMIRPFLKSANLPEGAMKNILRLGCYQILFLDRIPPHAAVNETVSLARALLGARRAGFVNAVLRNLLRNKDTLHALPDQQTDPVRHLSVKYSHPSWIVKKFLEEFGQETAREILQVNNERPDHITLRINPLRSSSREVMNWMRENHPEAVCLPGKWSPEALCVSGVSVEESWPPLSRGWVYVQDEAAQLVGYFASPAPGMKVVDMCSAPGGKITHIAELTANGALLIALDSSSRRLERVRENCTRMGLDQVLIRLSRPEEILSLAEEPADLVIADVPCSGFGTMRRHPDIRWNRTSEGISRLPEVQGKILEDAARITANGGIIVYSTCTILKAENEDVVAAFLLGHPEFSVDSGGGNLPEGARVFLTQEGYMKILPGKDLPDGFFAARIVKKRQ